MWIKPLLLVFLPLYFVNVSSMIQVEFQDHSPSFYAALIALTPIANENELIGLGNATDKISHAVTYAYVKKGNFQVFPINVLKSFPNVYNLNFYRQSISQLTAKSFEFGPNLKYVDLRYNKLTSLSSDVFKNLRVLSNLYISNNQITYVENFSGLETPNLVYIDARSNNLTNIFFMNQLRNISYFNVQDNLIEEINITSKFLKLSTLNIQSNNIASINPESFYNTPALRFFDVSNNECYKKTLKLNQENIAEAVELPLRPCYSRWNKLNPQTTTEYPIEVPASLTEHTPPPINSTIKPTTTTRKPQPVPLPYFSCNFYIDRVFGYSCALTHVKYQNETSGNFRITGKHLSGKNNNHVNGVVFLRSSLENVPKIIFQQFRNLTHLDISNVGMTKADGDTFTTCGKLKYLDASGNDIEKIIEAFLSTCKDLEVINLNNNLIKSISACGSFLKRQEKLKDVTMLFNHCIDKYFYDSHLIQKYDQILAEPFYQCFLNFLKPSK